MMSRFISAVAAAGLVVAAMALDAGADGTGAATLKTVYAFCPQSDCSGGREPTGGLVRDGTGNFYGTTVEGGLEDFRNCSNGCGVIYRIHPDTTPKKKPVFSVVHLFCKKSCSGGWAPTPGLVIDTDGNLYGTTAGGGKHASGTIFELTAKANTRSSTASAPKRIASTAAGRARARMD